MDENFNEYFDFSDEQIEALVDKYERLLGNQISHFFDVDDFLDIISYYSENSKYNKALKAINMAMKQHPMSSEILLLRANVFFNQQYYKKALNQLQEIEYLEKSNPEFQLLKGNVYVQLKNMHIALQAYHACLRLAEEDRFEFVEYIATYLVSTKHYKEALPFLEAGFKKDGFQYGLLYDLVTTYEKLNRQDDLHQLLIGGLDDDPFDAILWDKLGELLLAQGNNTEALDAYLYATAINDSLTDAYEKIAQLYCEQEDYFNATRYYEHLLTKDKENTGYMFELAHCHYLNKEYRTTVQILKRVLDFQKDNPEVYALLSMAEAKQDHIESAVEYLDTALFYEPNSAVFVEQKATLLIALGFDGQAFELFETSCSETQYEEKLCIRYVNFLMRTVFDKQITEISEHMAIDRKQFQHHIHEFIWDFVSVNKDSHIDSGKQLNIYGIITGLILSFSTSTKK